MYVHNSQDYCTYLMRSIEFKGTNCVKFSCHQKLDSCVPLYWSVVLINFNLHLVQVLHEALHLLRTHTNSIL